MTMLRFSASIFPVKRLSTTSVAAQVSRARFTSTFGWRRLAYGAVAQSPIAPPSIPASDFRMHESREVQFPSLTPLVVQIRWKVPTEFPSCPDEFTDDALLLYASRLSFGSIFAHNQHATSMVVDHRLKDDELVVLTRFAGENIKDWAVAHVSIQNGVFFHRSEFTFFTLKGALKHFCELVGEEITDSIDDDC